jgi:hypothetical protein
MAAWWLAPHSDYGTYVIGWLYVGIVLVLGIALYAWVTLWVARLLEQRRRELDRNL